MDQFEPGSTEETIYQQVQQTFRRYLILVAIVATLVGIAIGRFALGQGTQQPAALTPPPAWDIACAPEVASDEGLAPTVTPAALTVYVTGAVLEPGIVTVPAGSLLTDALEAAGGPSTDADLESLNLAAYLLPNAHIVVPRKAAPSGATQGNLVDPQGLININTATPEELESLPNIGPTRARQIVAYREENGPFEHKEDIQNVSGIGPSTYANIEGRITVEP